MKRYILTLVIGVFLTSCSAGNGLPDRSSGGATPAPGIQPSAGRSEPAENKIEDYFAFAKDVHMKYKGTGNEYAQYETYIDYLKTDTAQVRHINGGTVSVLVYKLKDGEIKKVFSQGETYYKYDYTSASNTDEIMVKEPIKEGTSWTLKDGAARSITAVDRQIKTPAGEFNALEITTKRPASTTKDYYAKGIGLVKTEFTSGDSSFTVVSELEKQEKDVPYRHKVRFYYPEFSKNRVVFVDRDVEIKTNEDMKFKFQKELKTIPENSGLTKVLSVNTSVLGSRLDEEKGAVTVDFSAQLVKEMNAGTALESMLLTSITNTFGRYYQKDKVAITIEGKPYESGHVLMKPGEYFNVDKEKQIEYKKP